MGMELPTIGGEDNAGRARRSAEVKLSESEAAMNFDQLKEQANKQAVHRFTRDLGFMETLRGDAEYQKLMDLGNFSDEEGFMSLAEHHTDHLEDAYGIESIRAQAALLASMAQLDSLVESGQASGSEKAE